MNGVVDKWFDGLLRQLVRPEHILLPITVKIHKERSQATMEMQDLLNGRCGWCGTDSLYVKYHDEEWGRLVTDDRLLFEFLTLESAQAGLSWITILRKRERYRKAFYDFDVNKVAQMTEQDVERLMQDEGIVRNRLKIKSAMPNFSSPFRKSLAAFTTTHYHFSQNKNRSVTNPKRSRISKPLLLNQTP